MFGTKKQFLGNWLKQHQHNATYMINYKLFVTREEYQNRYTICKTCEQFNSALALCKECSCFMPMKCKLSEAECPNQKWTTSSNRLTTELADL